MTRGRMPAEQGSPHYRRPDAAAGAGPSLRSTPLVPVAPRRPHGPRRRGHGLQLERPGQGVAGHRGGHPRVDLPPPRLGAAVPEGPLRRQPHRGRPAGPQPARGRRRAGRPRRRGRRLHRCRRAGPHGARRRDGHRQRRPPLRTTSGPASRNQIGCPRRPAIGVGSWPASPCRTCSPTSRPPSSDSSPRGLLTACGIAVPGAGSGTSITATTA